MKFSGLAAVGAHVVYGSTSNGHPIENVINMIKGLVETAQEEGKAEAESFDKFVYWCKTSKTELDNAIAASNADIEQLTEQIESEEISVAKLTKQIAQLEDDLGSMDRKASEAESIRKNEEDLYKKTSADLESTIQGVQDAITGLKESDGTFLAQKLSRPSIAKVVALAQQRGMSELAALLQKPEQLAAGDEQAHVKKYNFKSNNIIELLKELLRKFEDDLLAAKKGETNASNAYDMEKSARDGAIDAATKSKNEKEKIKADTSADLNRHKKEKGAAEDELEQDSKTLSDTDASCRTKSDEWAARSKVRSGEIEAMNVAIKILGKASGVRSEQPENPVPPPSPVSFLQVTDPRQQALNLLKTEARVTGSKSLAKMVQALSVHIGDPFKDINNMIEKMIFHLQDEQTQEDNHKAWCDQEISKTETSRENKEDKQAELQAKMDAATGHIGMLTSEIEAAQDMISKIDAYVKEATEVREIQKKENAAAIKDAKTAQNALANAIAVLTDFYKDSGMVAKEDWEFVQRGVTLPESPATWDSSYTGVSDPKNQPGGIISILEHTAAEFATMESDTKAEESMDQEQYDKSMADSKIEKATREQERDMKESEKKQTNDKLQSLAKNHKVTSTELEAVNQYFEDLKPACMNGDSSYEDRKAARDKEIEALRSAESILAKAFDEPASFAAVKKHM